MKRLSPSGTYTIDLPDDIEETIDEGVISLWRPDPNSEILLQLSSYFRFEGEQIAANERMRERIEIESLEGVQERNLGICSCPDQKSIHFIDNEGYEWVYCYAVWPDLAIFITLSGRIGEIENNGIWALDAVKALAR